MLSDGEITDELKQTLSGQKMYSLAAEVEEARQFCINFNGDPILKAKELKKDGKLSQIQEFLLIDLPTLIPSLDGMLKVATVNNAELCGIKVGQKTVKVVGTMFIKGAALLADFHSTCTGASTSDLVASNLKEADPHSLFIQFLVKFLDSLQEDEKKQIRSAVEKEMMPFLLTLGTELLKKHKPGSYLPHLIKLNQIIMQSKQSDYQDKETQKKQDKEVVKAFASIFLRLLEEIEHHYTPAFESLCDAFWEIGEKDPVVQWADRPASNFVEPIPEEKTAPEVVKNIEVVDSKINLSLEEALSKLAQIDQERQHLNLLRGQVRLLQAFRDHYAKIFQKEKLYRGPPYSAFDIELLPTTFDALSLLRGHLTKYNIQATQLSNALEQTISLEHSSSYGSDSTYLNLAKALDATIKEMNEKISPECISTEFLDGIKELEELQKNDVFSCIVS